MARMMAPPPESAAPLEYDLDRLRRIYRDMPQALVWIAADRRIADANAAAAGLLGVSRAALIGQSLDSAACRTTRRDGSEFPPGESPISRAFDSGRPVRNAVVGWRGASSDGVRWLLMNVVPVVQGHGGTAAEVFATLEDISTLWRREEYFQALIERASDMILVLDAQARLLYESPSNARHLGYPVGDLLGRSLFDLVHPEDRGEVEREFGALVADAGSVLEREIRCLGVGGDWRHLEVTARNMIDVHVVRGIVVNARDVTRRRALEAELLRAQKMEAIGRLAGGITHDFNNLLTTVEGNAALLLDRIGADGDGAEELRDILNAAQRATALTRSLLSISRNQAVNSTEVDVNAAVLDMQSMLRRTIPGNITLDTLLSPTPCRVRLGEGQCEQIVLNLVLNARDALQGGGRIEIQTAIEPRPHNRLDGSAPHADHGFVVLTVRDDGIGMDETTSAHVFEPFFTTKLAGHGTGLGLPTVSGIAVQAGGYVAIESAPGVGTVVTVRLPQLAPSRRRTDPAPPAAPERATIRRETILLVEDEAAVRGLARRILLRLGYQVLEAEDGLAALQVMRAHPGRIHLVLTDLVMPGLGGIDLAHQVAAERPGTRILFMSGYSIDALEGLAPGGATLIEKPFTPDILAGRVRQALEV